MTDIRQQPYSPFEFPAESSTTSLWKHTVEHQQNFDNATHFPPLQDTVRADVAVIGAGITGLTTALLLQKAGFKVVVVDAHPIAYGVSGFNSGHLTSLLLDMDIRKVLTNFGEEATRQVVLDLQKTIPFIERFILDCRIECDFKRVSGYLYAEQSMQLKDLDEIYDAYEQLGLRVSTTSRVPLPFLTEQAMLVADQARFHPLKYVQGLACAFLAEGGQVFENSRVFDVQNIEGEYSQRIATDAGEIYANDVVIATHTPIGFRPALQGRLEALRSYVIGIRTQDTIEDALYWDMDHPYHYIREASDEKGRLVIIGGEDHRTGDKVQTQERFERLETYARSRFRVDSVDYHWSAQLYDPADGLPYIGQLAGTYVATGYSGEGLTFGTLAAQIIADQIQGRENPCSDILNPSRTKPLASAGGVIADNVNTLTHFVKDRFAKAEVTTDAAIPTEAQVPVGEGKICEIEGRKVAVYHSPEGVMHFLSPVCTHMRCIVGWNAAEKSWDCPCHGGRFDATGKVLNGPPVSDLPPADL